MKRFLMLQTVKTCLLLLVILAISGPLAVQAQYRYVYESQLGATGKGLLQLTYPQGVAVDQEGYLYVADTYNYSVRKFDKEGNQLLRFGIKGNRAGGFDVVQAVRVDAQGYIYVLDRFRHVVLKFDQEGKFLFEFGGPGTGDGKLNFANDLAIDSIGNIFVVDTNNKRIQKFDKDGKYLIQFGNSWGSASELVTPLGIAIDKEGIVYVVDRNSNSTFRYDLNGNRIISGLRAPSVQSARAIAIDEAGNFYICGFSDMTKFTKTDTGYGYGWNTNDNGEQTTSNPYSVAVSRDGDVYVADAGNLRIQKYREVNNKRELVLTIGGAGNGDGEFLYPKSVAVNAANELFVLEEGRRRVQHFDSHGNLLHRWGSHGTEPGQFERPNDIALDAAGNVYISDEYNINGVQKFSPDGQLLQVFTGEGDAKIQLTKGIFVDKDYNLYVAGNGEVKKYDKEGRFVMGFSGNPNYNDRYTISQDVVVDDEGNVYILGEIGTEIHKYGPDGTFVKSWSHYSPNGYSFMWTALLTIDKEANLYLANYGHDVVQKYSRDGKYLGRVGTPGHEDGQLQYPGGVAVNEAGSVYVADSRNNRVQKFNPVPAARPELSQDKALLLSQVSAYRFESESVLETGSPVTFTLKNAGLENLQLQGNPAIVIEGTNPDDFILNATDVPASLAPDEQATFTIAFKPAKGGYRTADLKISTSHEESPIVIKMSGQGIRWPIVFNYNHLAKKFTDPDFTLTVTSNSTEPVNYSVVGGTGQVELSGENNQHVKIVKGGVLMLRATVKETDFYAGAYVNFQLVIERVGQQVSFEPISEKTYGDAPFKPVAHATSELPVDFYVVNGPAKMITDPKEGRLVQLLGAGEVTLAAIQAGNSDYEAAQAVLQTFTVNKRLLTVTAVSNTRVYLQPNPPLLLQYDGFAGSDHPGLLQKQPVAATDATPQSNAGKYPITVAGGSDKNYTFEYQAGTLTITKQKAPVTLSNLVHEKTGLPVAITVTTVPAGLKVIVYYNGSASPPAAAGSYEVEAFIDEVNYDGSARGILLITPSESAPAEEVSLYPNPSAGGKVNLYLEQPYQNGILEVLTLTGTLLKSIKLSGQDTQQLNLSDLKEGLYLIRVTGPSGLVKTIKYQRF